MEVDSVLWHALLKFQEAAHVVRSTLRVLRRPDEASSQRHAPYEPSEDQVRLPGIVDVATTRLGVERLLHLKDRVSYVFGVLGIILVAYVLGKDPGHFDRVYSFLVVASVLYRVYRYFRAKLHYFLIDLCYWINALLLAYIWIWPQSPRLFQAVFLLSNGPLAWSVVATFNSLVFHSSDKMTSVAIHLLPALTTWSRRWHGPTEPYLWCASHVHSTDQGGAFACELDLAGMTWDAACIYLVWLVAYSLWVFVVRSKHVERQGYLTLFTWLMTSNSTRGNPMRRLCALSPHPGVQRLIYLGTHLLFTVLTSLVALGLWHSFWAHTAFLLLLLCWAVWRAAVYYFDASHATHFDTRVTTLLKRSRSELSIAASQSSPSTDGLRGGEPAGHSPAAPSSPVARHDTHLRHRPGPAIAQ